MPKRMVVGWDLVPPGAITAAPLLPGAPDAVSGIIESYELAFRMQGKVPELLDLSKEPRRVGACNS